MYKIKLQCRCGHQSKWKEYDVTKQKMQNIINIAKRALRLPQYLICPECNGILSVQLKVETIVKE